MKIGAIVQARMRSIRLEGKVLMDIGGSPLLWHVLQRAAAIPAVDQVILATSDKPSDDVLETHARSWGIPCFRGSEEDVLARFYLAAKAFHLDAIIRLTADCPFLDPAVSGQVLQAFLSGAYDYASNVHPPAFPDGLDTEVFSFRALEAAYFEAMLPSEREHVTPYLWKNAARFRQINVTQTSDLSSLRWTVDEPADLAFVRTVYSHLQDTAAEPFSMQTILNLLQREPALLSINQQIARNLGYLQSLARDKDSTQ